MSLYNKSLLNVGNKVLVSVANTEGKVIDIGVESALVELTLKIDNQDRVVKQWYYNDVLQKIEKPVEAGVVEEKEKTIEFGVLPEEYVIGVDLAKGEDQSYIPKAKSRRNKV
jgi:hypothetical protein